MLSVQLYTVNSTANTPTAIDAVLALLDFTGSVDVSRTIGPANWYTLNKQMLAGTESVSFPREDIEGRPFTSARGIAKLRRKESVLTVSFRRAEAPKLSLLHQALRNDVPPQAAGFYISCVRLSFGPSDIFIPTEDKEGQEDVELIDLAQFIFSISCDRFGGRLDAFKEALQVVPQFIQFRSELEQVTGPLTLHFSR
jgi:hypothetical protein